MDKPRERKITWVKWGVRTLAISASTLAAVAFIKGEFQAASPLALAWLAIVFAEKRMFKSSSLKDEEPKTS